MVIGEDNSRVLQLQAGQIDAMINVPVNQIQSIGSSGDITAKVAPVYRIDMVQLNTTRKAARQREGSPGPELCHRQGGHHQGHPVTPARRPSRRCR